MVIQEGELLAKRKKTHFIFGRMLKKCWNEI